MNLFEMKIAGAMWYGNHGGTKLELLPDGAAATLSGEVMSWYNGLNNDVQFFVREVEIHPTDQNSVYVTITTRGIGSEQSNFSEVASGEKHFFYDLTTKVGGTACTSQAKPFAQCLDDNLRRILSFEAGLAERVASELRCVVAKIKTYPEKD